MAKEKEEAGVSIDKITLKIGDTKLPVTMDQAKKLHAALSEMFGTKEVVRHEYRYDHWNWPWSRPYFSYGGSLGSLGSLNISGSGQLYAGKASEYSAGGTMQDLQLKANDLLPGTTNLLCIE